MHLKVLKKFISLGNLQQLINERGALQETLAFTYFFQSLCAIEYLHSQDIVHQNLKLENVLLDNEGKIKLSDYGWKELGLSVATKNLAKNKIEFMVNRGACNLIPSLQSFTLTKNMGRKWIFIRLGCFSIGCYMGNLLLIKSSLEMQS